MNRSKIVLLCGLPATGKTTYAKKIAESKNAIVFTLDKLLFTCYGKDFNPKYYKEYEKRIVALVKDLLPVLVPNGQNIILDFGFYKKEDRDYWKAYAKKIGADTQLVYFEIDENEIKNRLEKRNQNLSYYDHEIPWYLFLKLKKDFQTPSPKEIDILVSTKK